MIALLIVLALMLAPSAGDRCLRVAPHRTQGVSRQTVIVDVWDVSHARKVTIPFSSRTANAWTFRRRYPSGYVAKVVWDRKRHTVVNYSKVKIQACCTVAGPATAAQR